MASVHVTREGGFCWHCSQAAIVLFESEGAEDDGEDSSAYLSFCRDHGLAFVDELRSVADALLALIVEEPALNGGERES